MLVVVLVEVTRLQICRSGSTTRPVGIQPLRSIIRSLRNEKDEQGQQGRGEYGAKVKSPLPTHRAGHLAHNDGREECTSEKCQITERHALSPFVDKVQIADGRIDERLKGRQTDALEHARGEQGLVIVPARAAPYRADDDNDRAEDIEMSLPPHPRRRHA